VFPPYDAEAVVKLYAPDAILLGTVSPVIAEGISPLPRRSQLKLI
jgi:hypothetical protein